MKRRGASNSIYMIVIGVVGFLAIGGAFAVGTGAVPDPNQKPNTLGTQSVVNPMDKHTKDLLATLNAAIAPDQFLHLNRDSITQIELQLDDMLNYWQSKNILTGDDLTAATDKINTIKQLLEQALKLEADLNTGGTADQVPTQNQISALRTQILQNIQDLSNLLQKSRQLSAGVGTALELANALVNLNLNGGGLIPYRAGMNPNIQSREISNGQYKGVPLANAAKTMDCSGFVSYVLIGAGVIPGHMDTAEFSTNTQYFDHITINQDQAGIGNGTITESDYRNAIANGLLQPGDLMVSGLSDGEKDPGNTHIVMINGHKDNTGKLIMPGYDDTDGILQSTNRDNRNGPQYASFASRANRYIGKIEGSEVIFIRPKYK